MKIVSIKSSTFFLVLIFCISLKAQKNMLRAELGYITHFAAKLSGVNLGITYQRKINEKFNYSLDMGYSFSSGRGLLNNDDIASKIKIRSYLNPIPYDAVQFGWSEKGFPQIRLSVHPDKQFNMSLCNSVNYSIAKKGKNEFLVGLGIALTYFDAMSLDEILQGQYKDILFDINENVLLPVFKYEEYIDIGFLPYLGYVLHINDKLFWSLNTKFGIYPDSNNYFNMTSVSFGFKF
jgi:hypothetical protein